ncbi:MULTISPECIES: LamG domain-containing protein [Niastella]|uniref:LamG domain-containing protein n=1 Tax=Niastella soli TaxID=2821487 RepID=A0ABS3Z344_9BACT|nr:LamG domain-containing protein [Niastella soli]MBO9204584.1 LamG domain-containing protein [Niastella soli]
MKKSVLCFLALSTLLSFFACKKDCEECKTCDNTQDTVIRKDTIYIPPPPDTTCKTDLTKGLLAYFPFNGNFNDESGNGNNATSKNGAYLTTDFVGRTNRSAGFDGVDDYLIVPGSSKLNADTVTISYQVLVNNTNRTNVTVSRINFESGASYAYGIHSQAASSTYGFGLVPGTDDCTVRYSSDPAGSAYTKGTIQTGRWYNIIATFANGVQKIYMDGVLQNTLTRTFKNVKKCDNGDLMIGGWWKNDVISIDGKIDEVRLYKRVLNDCEISKLAESFK